MFDKDKMFRTLSLHHFPSPYWPRTLFSFQAWPENADSGLLYAAGCLEYSGHFFTISVQLLLLMCSHESCQTFKLQNLKGGPGVFVPQASGSSVGAFLPFIHCSESTQCFPSGNNHGLSDGPRSCLWSLTGNLSLPDPLL